MKIAVIGANGQLGTDVVSAFSKEGHDVSVLTHSDIELSDLDSVSKQLKTGGADVVVNTAAMHNVDNCEKDPQRAFAVNAVGARNLSLVANDLGAKLIHVSTDYVFDGAKSTPYEESDAPNPLNVYGNSKLAGEYFVRNTAEKHFVVRTSAIYGKSPCRAKGGLNFIDLMLKLSKERSEVRVVDSEVVTPTSTSEIASQIVVLSKSDAYGLYHATAEGSCSWYEFAKEIFSLTNTKITLKIADPKEFPAKVRRPQYSVLENRSLNRNRINLFKPWQQGLREYLAIA
ncbi:MAG: dTDP-4-dehydrorhamnose reductase [Acidobacteria bacterium]|nr:MAG: dTDP-4-dehydrorhamnose reductase [Acidobacteriota bacterium]